MATSYDPYGIKIDGEGDDEYERGVKWRLDFISRSQTGRALLRAIQATPKQLTINPWNEKDGYNALTRPHDPGPKGRAAATAAGEFVLDSEGKPPTANRPAPVLAAMMIRLPLARGKPRIPEPYNYKGTGQGTDVDIFYDPWMFGWGGSVMSNPAYRLAFHPNQLRSNPNFLRYYPTRPCVSPSAALFHEMVHAFREMRGHSYNGRTMGRRAGYENEEEFFAIVLTNIFVSDPTTPVAVRDLRHDHDGHDWLPPAQATSSGFLADPANQRLLTKFIMQEPGLVNDLLNVKASFNPIRQLKQNMTGSNITVMPGDTVSDLAQKHYGSAEYWPLLWDANRATIGPNPNLIRPGMPLTIPAFSSLTPAQLQDAKQRFPTWRNYH